MSVICQSARVPKIPKIKPAKSCYQSIFADLPLKTSIFFFFARSTGLQGKGEDISLTPHHHFHLLHRHLDISRAITAESSPLHIASSRTQTGNLLVSEHIGMSYWVGREGLMNTIRVGEPLKEK